MTYFQSHQFSQNLHPIKPAQQGNEWQHTSSVKCKVQKNPKHFIIGIFIDRMALRGHHRLLRSPGADQCLFRSHTTPSGDKGPQDTPGEASACSSTHCSITLFFPPACSWVLHQVLLNSQTCCTYLWQRSAPEEWQSCRKWWPITTSAVSNSGITKQKVSFLRWGNAYRNHGALLKRNFRAKILGIHLLNMILYKWDRLKICLNSKTVLASELHSTQTPPGPRWYLLRILAYSQLLQVVKIGDNTKWSLFGDTYLLNSWKTNKSGF